MNPKKYALYTATDCWKQRRGAYLQRNEKMCQVCGKNTDELQVHHLTYERLGEETDEDLIAVCDRCHRCLHSLAMRSEYALPLAYLRTLLVDCNIRDPKLTRVRFLILQAYEKAA